MQPVSIRYKYRFLLFSVLAALAAWAVDAAVDSFVFGRGSFLDSLILEISPHELYFRLFLVTCFSIFGLVISRMLISRWDAEERLRNALSGIEDEKARSEAIIAAIPDGITILDRNFRVLYQNDVHKAMLGDHVGKTCYEVYDLREARCPDCPVARVFEDGGLHVLEKSRQSGQGTVHFEIHAAPLRNARGEIIAGIEAVRDVTRRKRIEDELERHRERLTELVDERTAELQREMLERQRMEQDLVRAQKLESLGVLAGGIAHDFNNLLGAIMGNLSLALLDCEPAHPAHRQLANAEKASLRAQELTQQLLTFSKGGAPLKRPVSLAGIVREAAGFSLAGSSVKYDLVIADDLWAVEADEGQLTQVFQNLLLNADHAMPGGGVIRITAHNIITGPEAIPFLREGRYVHVTVKDHGTGIAPENLQRIFDPYFTTKEKGSGLGLAATYSIIKKHDGHITVDSLIGKGSVFHVYLPATERGPDADAGTAAVRMGSARVLVMDDEEDMRRATGDMLSRLGYSVAFAEEGMQAVVRYQMAMEAGIPFDAVIMDLTIPGGMGGKEAVRKLLEIDPLAKVIVSSGYSQDPVMADYRGHGFQGRVTKPYRVQDLSEVVAAVIGRSSEEGAERCSSES